LLGEISYIDVLFSIFFLFENRTFLYLLKITAMITSFSNPEIGSRLLKLRKHTGYSQADVAHRLRIARTAYTQLELGKRAIQVNELIAVSDLYKISIDEFLSKNFRLDEKHHTDSKVKPAKQQDRISVPKLQVEKFKQVLLYILERCAAKPNFGETLLNKLLYFSDFNYYELYEEQLTGAEYRKLQFGPVPQKMSAIIKQMQANQQLECYLTKSHIYDQKRYIPLVRSDISMLKATEKEVIDRVIDQYSDWTAKAISEYSHKDIPWAVTKDSEVIDYELALYRASPFSVRTYLEEDV
jgi:transcriptional regulator with XRE-family HTH domain